jgi:hypothetical protein
MKKASDSAKELAKKKASKNGKQNSQVTSNIPSAPTSYNSGKGLSGRYAPALRAEETEGNNPAGPMRGYKTKNENPYSSSGGGSMSGEPNRNYPGKSRK